MDFKYNIKYLKQKTRLVGVRDLKWPLVAVFAVLILSIHSSFFKPPKDYPIYTIFTIEEGDTVSKVADSLKESRVIKSSFVFKVASLVLDGKHGVRAGDYYLNKKESPVRIALRMARASFGLEPVRLFLPEGLNVFEMAESISASLLSMEPEDFLKEAMGLEGYLFPDTYHVLPNAKPKTIVKMMTDNFNSQIKTLENEVSDFGRPLEDVVKMASILEREARQLETKRIIAGILWKRLDEGIPLQVDVSFKYINGKGTFDLTLDDLKIDSPYNTYVHKGLPPTPIANAGLDSILAAVTPVETDYYFFLTGRDGHMYYAANHDQHVENKSRYLR